MYVLTDIIQYAISSDLNIILSESPQKAAQKTVLVVLFFLQMRKKACFYVWRVNYLSLNKISDTFFHRAASLVSLFFFQRNILLAKILISNYS